jgi:hypothetical protein
MARTEAYRNGISTRITDDGFLNPNNALNEAAMDGVSCTVCHQIQDIGLGEARTFSGNYPIDTSSEPPERLIFGPFPDAEQQTMRSVTGYTPVEGRQVTDAGLCATCHTLYTPYVDSEGNVAGEFPEQTPYLEWQLSDYGDGVGEDRPCQGCHMPEAEGGVTISTVPGGLEERSPFFQHHFVGGSVSMLRLFRANVAELGLTASTGQLDATITRTLDQLRKDTATLSIVETALRDNELSAVLKVENKAGHKLPTGYPSRQVWVHFKVTDTRGQIVFESGGIGDDGSISGGDDNETATTYEPHYEVITRPDQVQIYQSVMQDTDGNVTHTLLRGAAYRKDNRLLPAGFVKTDASPDIAVYGKAASDVNFDSGGDQITYKIHIEGYSAPFTVHAELLYQSVSYAFLRDLALDRTPLVERFFRLYDSVNKEPALIAIVEAQVR